MADTVGPSAAQTKRDPTAADKPDELTGEGLSNRKHARPRDERGWVGRLVARVLLSAVREKIKPRKPRPRSQR
jgi:hypothetical protein